MKKVQFIFIIFFSIYHAKSQNIKVFYKVEAENIFNTNNPDTLPDIVQETFKEAERNFDKIDYQLDISYHESYFRMENKLLNEGDRKAKLAIALAGFSGKTYCDSKNNSKLRQSDVYGQTFLISSVFNSLDWTITKETKQVAGIKAYKAIAKEYYDTGKSREAWIIIAWFAPELNYPFGPGGYGGLPGLIVELSRAGKIYTMDKLEEMDAKLEIEKPKKGKRITKDKFEKIGRRMELNEM